MPKKDKEKEQASKIASLRAKQALIRSQLDRYTSYYQGLGLVDMLQETANFIEMQTEDFEEIKGHEEESPVK